MTLGPRVSRRAAAFLAAFGIALPLAAATAARAYHNFWANCVYTAPTYTETLTRDWAQSYSNLARYEGYHWGGGCWNTNDVDEGYGDPPQNTGTHGEGGDCSGLTFKTWRESDDPNRDGRYYWYALRNVHGPYNAAAFKSGWGAPHDPRDKPGAGVMDAFASEGHVGMVFFRASTGGDQIVEAKCELCGTNIWYRTYRSESAYGGVRRWGWTG